MLQNIAQYGDLKIRAECEIAEKREQRKNDDGGGGDGGWKKPTGHGFINA